MATGEHGPLVARVELDDTFDVHRINQVLASRPPDGDWVVVVVASGETHTGRGRGSSFAAALTAAVADLRA